MSGTPLRQSPFDTLPSAKADPDEPFFNFLVASAVTGLLANESLNEWTPDDIAESAVDQAEAVQRKLKQRRTSRPAL